jgi:hypothetical protein
MWSFWPVRWLPSATNMARPHLNICTCIHTSTNARALPRFSNSFLGAIYNLQFTYKFKTQRIDENGGSLFFLVTCQYNTCKTSCVKKTTIYSTNQ